MYLANGVSPTDALGYGLMATGMAKHMGDQSKPPIALTLWQILWIMNYLDTRWHQTRSYVDQCEIAVAAVTHLLGWLGWLHSVELFSLTWGDICVTPTVGFHISWRTAKQNPLLFVMSLLFLMLQWNISVSKWNLGHTQGYSQGM